LFSFVSHPPHHSCSYPLSLHDALPISIRARTPFAPRFSFTTHDNQAVSNASLRGKVVLMDFWGTWCPPCRESVPILRDEAFETRSEEHTSELQSLRHLVCRLLLEKKKK